MRVFVIANSKAGQGVRLPAFLRRLLRVPVREYLGAEDLRRRVEVCFARNGIETEWAETHYAGHARELANAAADKGFDVVVAVGGDGTVNEVVNGLAGTQTALGVIPAGTANLLAGELGLPAEIDAACEVISRKKLRVMDLPFINDRSFAMMAGIGFDAHVVRLVDRRLKGRWGIFSYLIVTFRELMRYRFDPIEVRTDSGEHHSGYYMFVQNARSYGSGYSASPGSLIDDGLMELIIFPRRNLLTVVQYLLSADKSRFDVTLSAVKSVEILSGHDIQIDGDFYGCGPARIGIKPGALRVAVP